MGCAGSKPAAVDAAGGGGGASKGEKSNVPTTEARPWNVYVKDLDKNIDDKAFYDTFALFGNIKVCKVLTDSSGQSLGYGFIWYECEEAAKQSIERVNGMQIGDSTVFVGDFANYIWEKEAPEAPAAFAAASWYGGPPGMQKQMLGERLFPAIAKYQPELAGKITGKMLEMDDSELLILLEWEEQLKNKIEETMRVLESTGDSK